MTIEHSDFPAPPEDLDQSFPLEPMRIKAMGEQQHALKDLLAELVTSHPTKLTKDQRDDLRSVYRQILLNVTYNSIHGAYTALPRGSTSFSEGTYWRKLGLTYKFTIAALDRLVEQEYIIQMKGVYNGPGGFSRLTRVFGTNKLSKVINIQRVINTTQFMWDEDAAPVVLTNFPYKADILAEDHPDVYRVRAINRFLKDHSWPQCSPVRIIYKSDPMHSGRVYTRFQNMKRELRAKMRIDGKRAVEIDYKSNHLKMLIAMQGYELPNDPYQDIADLAGMSREEVKAFCRVAIGANSQAKAFKALNAEGFTNIKSQLIRDTLLKMFPGVPLFRGFGAVLQSLEGQIALDLMYEGALGGIVVLPVHDSFITTIENKDWLVQHMLQKWADHVRAGAETTVEQKW